MSIKPKLKDLDVSVLDRIVESETNANTYTDEKIADLGISGSIKHSYDDYILTATTDNQTDFEIPLATFDVVNDKLTVVQQRTYLTKDDYTVVSESGKNIIRLVEGVSSGTELYIVIDKNIIREVDEGISGAIITPQSIPLNKLQEDVERKVDADGRELAIKEYVDLQTKSKESVETVLDRGVQIANVEHDSLGKVLSFKGRTTVNLVPLFDSGLWVVHVNAVVNSSNKLTLTPTALGQTTYVDFPVKANSNYSWSIKASDNAQVRILFKDNVGATITTVTSSTGTVISPSNAVSVRLGLESVNQTGICTFENVMLNEGTTAQPFVANVQGVTNPTIEVGFKNIIDDKLAHMEDISLIKTASFGSSGVHAVISKDFVNKTSGENSIKMEFDHSQKGVEIADINIKREGYYVIGFDGMVTSGTTYFYLRDIANSVNLVSNTYPSDFIPLTGIFSPVFTKFKITEKVGEYDLYFRQSASSSEKAILNIDSLRIYEISKDVYDKINVDAKYTGADNLAKIFPLQRKEDIKSITLLGTFHEGDEVTGDTVTRKKKEVVLDGSLDWKFGTDHAGYKQVHIPKPSDFSTAKYAVKFNGKIITEGTGIDNFVIGGSVLYFIIADPDSGWGETYTPTADEIKAYFMGWKMMDVNGNVYNTGTKYWRKLKPDSPLGYDSSGVAETVVPTLKNESIEPYRLLYDLATPTTEKLQTIGSISLHEGDNQIELSEGRVVRERAYVYLGATSAIINTTNLPLKNKVGKVLQLLKNGEPENRWILQTHDAYGNERWATPIVGGVYDPTAIYEVDYIPLEPYKLTTETNPITVEYQSNLGSVVSNLTQEVTEHENRLNIVEKDMVRKDKPVQWFTPTLLNGWSSLSLAPIRIAKDDSGIVHIEGSITGGDTASGKVLFVLPKGFRPSKRVYASSNAISMSNAVKPISFIIYEDGKVTTDPVSDYLVITNILFKSEQ